MPDLVPIRFRDCACPGSPHPDGDVAQLRPYLDFAGGAEALASITVVDDDGNARLADVIEWRLRLGPIFMRRGVVTWNLTDENGDPVAVTPETLEALRFEDAFELADRADDLYGAQITSPLLKKMQNSSPVGRTNGSTPRRHSPSRKRRQPSASSS